MSDKQRAEFEKWAVLNGYNTMQKDDKTYLMTSTTLSWNAWQAAIASVVVELPEIKKAATNEHPSESVYIADYIYDAFKNAGIRYE